ncbi:MAG: hypothetical protein ACLRUZ_09345 [Faecalimonas sp.]
MEEEGSTELLATLPVMENSRHGVEKDGTLDERSKPDFAMTGGN